jgi:hypothetical protein
MATPQMKTDIEEFQTEQLRNAAEAKAIYWYPGRDQRRRPWMQKISLVNDGGNTPE